MMMLLGSFPFDARSIVAVTGLLSALVALAMLYLRRELLVSSRGTGVWAGGVLGMFLALILMGGRDTYSDLLSLLVANAVLWAGMAAIVIGLCRFTGRAEPMALLVGAGVLFVVLTFWVGIYRPDYPALLVSNASFIALFALLSLRAAYVIQPRSLPVAFLIASYAFLALVCLLRIAAVLGGIDQTASLLDTTPIQTIFLVIFGLACLFANTGFVMAVVTQQHEVLRRSAAYDPLSGLLNRGAVTDRLRREANRAARSGRPLSVLMIDIDHFKSVNDSYGHACGDQIIVEFARRAVSLLRGSDGFGRYGGEEFLALLPETDVGIAQQVAERLRFGIMVRDGEGPSYTVSIGVASLAPAMTVEALLQAADVALYQAKANGRNRVELAVAGSVMPSGKSSTAR